MTKSSETLKISLPLRKRTGGRQMLSIIIESLIAIMFLVGITSTLNTIFLPGLITEVVLFIGIIGCVLFTILLTNRRTTIIGVGVIIVWILIFCIAMQPDMLDGLRLVANHISELIGRRFGEIMPIYDVTVPTSEYQKTVTLFMVPMYLLLALFCSWLVHAREVIVSFVMIIVLLLVIILLRTEFPFEWMVLLIFAEVFLMVKAHEVKKNFIQYLSAGSVIMPILAAIILSIVILVISNNIPEYNNPTVKYRMELLREIEHARYGIKPESGMADGDFSDITGFNPSTDTALLVTMANPESLWLRGFVGSQYVGDGWKKDDPAALYENADLFYWLHEDNFYGQKQIADAAIATEVGASLEAFGMQIANTGASSRNIYAPYEVYLASEGQMPANGIGDVVLKGGGLRGSREYQYFTMPNQVKRYPDISKKLFDENADESRTIKPYLLMEGNYAQYVYEQYTSLPKEVNEWMEEYLQDMMPRGGTVEYSEARQAIIKYFSEETNYSTTPKMAGSGDLAHDFLLLDREGYSVHYATSATLLFRAYGIPARYVEGYIITPKDVEGAANDSTFQIDGTHAHAWVEVYQNGIGWIPVETTPPYLGLMEEADILKGVPSVDEALDIPPVEDEYIEEQTEDLETVDGKGEEVNYKVFVIIISAAIAVVILAIFLLVRYLIRKRQYIQTRVAVCLNSSNKIAVIGMFACAMETIEQLGFKDDKVWLASHLEEAVQSVEGLSVDNMSNAFACYQEAGYSTHDIGDEKRTELKSLMSELSDLLQEKYTGLSRLKVDKTLKILDAISDT